MSEHFLRDAIADQETWQRDRQTLSRELLEAREDMDRLRLLGRLGDHLRMAPDHVAEAIDHLDRAVALARQIGHPAALAGNLIRLATAEQYRGQHEQAVATFTQARAVIDAHGLEGLRDFAYQHVGKCLAEMGRWDEARSMFQEAASLRESRGAAGLLASTRQALSALDAMEAAANDADSTKP